VEGPFARNALYVEALSKATERSVMPVASSTGTSVGAALLALGPSERSMPQAGHAAGHHKLPKAFREYAAQWNRLAQAR
jgi:sugar (pentulose or hexulose) kinase